MPASGGTSPYTWAITAGALPPGLTLDPDGTISGQATLSGSYTLTVQITDSFGQVSTETVTVIAKPADLNSRLIAVLPDATGYWIVDRSGTVLAFGHAVSYGDLSQHRANHPVTGIVATPDGRGYWLVTSDGGVFAFGDAHSYGSTGGWIIKAPIVGMTATPDGFATGWSARTAACSLSATPTSTAPPAAPS